MDAIEFITTSIETGAVEIGEAFFAIAPVKSLKSS